MMSSKLAFATILVASYATTAEAAGSCIAKTANEWAALGLTVGDATGTDVLGLGTIGVAPGWSETGSADAVCAGGAALAALTDLPAITGGVAATYESVASTSSGSGTGLVATIVVASATALTSITVTTAGSGYSIGNTVTFAASANEYDAIVYTLVAADFDAFTASGVTEVSGKCSGNLQTNTNLATQVGGLFQYDCGTGYTVKDSTVALSGGDPAAMKTACCTADTTTVAPTTPAPTTTTVAPTTPAPTATTVAPTTPAPTATTATPAPAPAPTATTATTTPAPTATTTTTTPAPATTTEAPKTNIDPGTEDSAAAATLGVASALAAAAAFARLL